MTGHLQTCSANEQRRQTAQVETNHPVSTWREHRRKHRGVEEIESRKKTHKTCLTCNNQHSNVYFNKSTVNIQCILTSRYRKKRSDLHVGKMPEQGGLHVKQKACNKDMVPKSLWSATSHLSV